MAYEVVVGNVPVWGNLPLQLSFLLNSESMVNHDSDIVEADCLG